MNVMLAFATKEFQDHVRNGWIISLAAAFALFALVISLAGFGFTGNVGSMETGAALRSLTSLALYLIPLMGLLLGYDGIAGERERGTLDLLRSYPVSAVQVTLGKLFGLGSVMGLTLFLGLLAPALLALGTESETSWWVWPAFLVLAVWLGTIFIALAIWLSTLAQERSTVLGLAIAVWLVLVLLFDLGLIGLLVATEGAIPAALVHVSFILNPASLFRVMMLGLLMGETTLKEMGFGAGGVPWVGLWAGAFLWSMIPIWLAARRLGRME